MRNSTLITISVATLSALYLAQNTAILNQQPMTLSVQPSEQQTQASSEPDKKETLPDPQPEESAPLANQASDPGESAPAKIEQPAEPTAESGQGASEPAQAPSEPTENVAEPAAPAKVTVSSDVINYEYGVIQLSVTAVDGTLTNVSMIQGDAGFGRGDAYTALISATLSAQGTNFGNYSGSTFTTEAFRSAVANAIGKL